MAEFNWTARSLDGVVRKGVMESETASDVESRLKSMNLTPIKVKKKAKEIYIVMPWQDPVPVKTKVIFTRQLATMIDAGLPLVQCLEILSSQEPHGYFRRTLMQVKNSVEGGSTFADALAKHPRVFDDLFTNLVSAGEAGGLLDTILNRLAIYMEKNMALKMRMKSAMRYPVVTLSASLIITGVLLVKVIPSFAGIYSSVGGKDLPALTQMVINISDAVIASLPLVITIAVSIFVAFFLFVRTEFGQLTKDRVLLRTPVIGTLIKKSAIARFTRTLGTLIASGVPILEAMDIVARTAGNKVIEGGIVYTRDRISEGKNIAGPLMEMNVFPSMVVQMISVGESTGALDVMLTKIADFYEDEVDAAVDGLTSVIEPIMMIGIGGIVAFVLIAMYLPIFSLADNVGGAPR